MLIGFQRVRYRCFNNGIQADVACHHGLNGFTRHRLNTQRGSRLVQDAADNRCIAQVKAFACPGHDITGQGSQHRRRGSADVTTGTGQGSAPQYQQVGHLGQPGLGLQSRHDQ